MAALLPGGGALAIPQESATFTNVLSRGPLGSSLNLTRQLPASGVYSAGRVIVDGVLTPRHPGTWASDARILVTAPNSTSTIVQPSDVAGFDAPLAVHAETELSSVVSPATGTWTFRFFESFVDDLAGGDATWTSIRFTLDDLTPPPRWTEAPDAPDLPSQAQVCRGTGTLMQIRGTVQGDDADLFLIEICDADHFSATTVAGADWDTQLFLFDLDGRGVAFNDDSPLVSGTQSTLTDRYVPANGRYYLAISRFDKKPVDRFARRLWENEPLAVERFPDGPGAAEPVHAWETQVFGVSGPYLIHLTGCCFVDLAPPCVADVDDGFGSGVPDGGVTIDDLLFYLGAFTAGVERADVDDDGEDPPQPDGGVTIEDLIYFLVRYTAGC
jgi:hypothetical protein